MPRYHPLRKTLVAHLRAHPSEPLIVEDWWRMHPGGGQKLGAFTKGFIDCVRRAAKKAGVKMPKVLRPKDPIPTELFTLKGTRFMWNRRGNSRYARAGLDAQIKAHLIDNPGEKITTLPAALYMGHNPKKPLSAHERYTLSASIRNMAKRAQSELKCSMPRRHGGDSTGIPSNADRVILQRLQGRRKVNVIKAIADVAVELGGRVVSPSKLETVAKTLPTDRRPELIGSHDWNNATKNAIRTSLHARGIMPIFFEHKGRSSIRDA